MFSKLINRMTFANVISVVALFIAIGGSAYAAGLAKNSVGSKQLKAKGVKNGDLADNVVTSPKVANGSLLGEDFAVGQLPTSASGSEAGPVGPRGVPGQDGAPGTQGDPGATGAPGVSGYQRVFATSPPAGAGDDTRSFNVSCPAGKQVLGGGAGLIGAAWPNAALDYSAPNGSSTGWTAAAHEHLATTAEWNIEVFAICANVVP